MNIEWVGASLVNDHHCTHCLLLLIFLCFKGRFKKLNVKGFQSNDGSLQNEATLEKDRCPLIFKFNEVCCFTLFYELMQMQVVLYLAFDSKTKHACN